MRKLRWGVIGAGGIADRRTIPGLLKTDNSELIAVMEINPELTEKLRSKYHAQRGYTSDLELLKDPEIDAVYIASPVAMHAKQVMAAADAGKDILVEKPIAMSSEEGQKVLEYCWNKGVHVAAGFMMRFGSYVQEMKKAIAAGSIGDVVSNYTQFTCWYPDMSDSWRQKKSIGGGGCLMDMGVHCIDLIQYVSGMQVKQVAAFNDTQTFHYEVEDSSSLLLRLSNGAQCVVQTNFNIPDQASKWRFDFFGTKGHLVGDGVIGQVDGGSLDALYIKEDIGGYDAVQNDKKVTGEDIQVQFGDCYQREIESFANSILYNQPLEVPAEEAVYVQKIIEAAYFSNTEKRIVEL